MNPQDGEVLPGGLSATWCAFFRWLTGNAVGSTAIIVLVIVFALVVSIIIIRLAHRKTKKETRKLPPRTPILLGSWAFLAGSYVLARIFDIVMALRQPTHPRLLPSEAARTSFFERLLVGNDLTWPLMPLADRPAVGILLHLLCWGVLLVGVFALWQYFGGTKNLRASLSRDNVPWSFQLSGCSTTCGLDRSVRAWLLPLTIFLGLAVLFAALYTPSSLGPGLGVARCLAGGVAGVPAVGEAGAEALDAAVAGLQPAATDPGVLVLMFYLAIVLALHLAIPPVGIEVEVEEGVSEADPGPVDPLTALRESLARVLPGAEIAPEEITLPPETPTVSQWPSCAPELLRDTFSLRWIGGGTLFHSQAQVFKIIHRSLHIASKGEAESRDFTSVRGAGSDENELPACDSLVLCGSDGCGRSTTLLAAAMMAFLERAGVTLILTRDVARLEVLWDELSKALESSAIKWALKAVRTGHDLRDTLHEGCLPGIVLADLRTFEEEVLIDLRSERIIETLDLVLVDEFHEFVGPAEMHLSLALARLWLCVENADRPPGLPPIMATSGPLSTESSAWATRILGRRASTVRFSGPASRERALVRRRHLAGPDGEDLSIADLARASELAKLPWHLRMSGDGKRAIQRMDGDLRAFSEYRVAEPSDAAVVLLEGSFGEVEREIRVTSLVGQSKSWTRGLQIAAPPMEEEAALEPLGDALPWLSIPLVPPPEIRLTHAIRATHSRELPIDGIRDRLLSGRLGEELDKWLGEGALEASERFSLTRSSFQPVIERLVTRATSAPLPGLDIDCVSSNVARLFDDSSRTDLRHVDAASAPIIYYPGAVVLLPEGRFRVALHPDRWRIDGEGYAATIIDSANRTVVERSWTPDDHGLWKLSATDRSLGKRMVRCRSGLLSLRQRVVACRLYGQERELLEKRDLNPSIETTLSTQIVLVSADLDESHDLDRGFEIMAPIVGALSLAVPSVVRCSRQFLQLALVEHGGRLHVGFFDRTPGGNGAAFAVDDSALSILLKMALAVLDNLTDDQLQRVRALFDEVPGSLSRTWDIEAARSWLRTVVDPPESGDPIQDLPPQPVNDSFLQQILRVFPAVSFYPPAELSLFIDAVQGCLETIPMRIRYGAHPSDDDRVCAAAGLSAVFFRRPDINIPKGFYIVFEPGHECRGMPGAAAYCRVGSDWHIALALEQLRGSIPLDAYSTMPHEAGHLYDALDGDLDGIPAGLSGSDLRKWREAVRREIPRAASGNSLLSAYASTNSEEFLAEAVAAFVEVPRRLRKQIPQVYEGLRSSLRQDPASWEDRLRRK